jgi:hypothetical protein
MLLQWLNSISGSHPGIAHRSVCLCQGNSALPIWRKLLNRADAVPKPIPITLDTKHILIYVPAGCPMQDRNCVAVNAQLTPER